MLGYHLCLAEVAQQSSKIFIAFLPILCGFVLSEWTFVVTATCRPHPLAISQQPCPTLCLPSAVELS